MTYKLHIFPDPGLKEGCTFHCYRCRLVLVCCHNFSSCYHTNRVAHEQDKPLVGVYYSMDPVAHVPMSQSAVASSYMRLFADMSMIPHLLGTTTTRQSHRTALWFLVDSVRSLLTYGSFGGGLFCSGLVFNVLYSYIKFPFFFYVSFSNSFIHL